MGVNKLLSSLRACRDGVLGNRREPLDGVPALLDGVIGNGTANVAGRFVGDLLGEREEDGVGDVGLARIEAEEGDFGEDEARRRVSLEGFAGVGNGGKVAIGILGVESVSTWS